MVWIKFDCILIILLFLYLKLTSTEPNKVDDDVISKAKVTNQELHDYKCPQIFDSEDVYLYEPFDNFYKFKQNWVKSEAINNEAQFKYSGLWDIVRTNSRIRGN
jgi:hypothetical protein